MREVVSQSSFAVAHLLRREHEELHSMVTRYVNEIRERNECKTDIECLVASDSKCLSIEDDINELIGDLTELSEFMSAKGNIDE